MKHYVELDHQGLTLRGYHHKEENDQVLVMFHGFTGNKTEVGYLFRKLSDALQHHCDTIRFDYLGSGESDGLFSDMTLPNLIEQAHTILNYTKKQGYKKMHLLGFSMGGALTMNLLDEADKTILIAPAIEFDTLNPDRVKEIKLLPNGNYDLNGYELNKDLTRSFTKDYFGWASKHNRPVLTIQGTWDTAVSYETSKKLSETFSNGQLLTIDEGGHTFQNRNQYLQIEQEINLFLE